MLITKAEKADLPEILRIQKAAFMTESKHYPVNDITPIKDTLDDVNEDFRRKLVLKAVVDGVLAGSARGHMEGDTCMITKVIVDPAFHNKGIGSALMDALEKSFPKALRFELFTGFKSEKNLHFYKKLGYSVFKTEKKSENLSLVHMEKKART